MAVRLTFLAHGPTARTKDSVFGDTSDLVEPPRDDHDLGRIRRYGSAPEPACRQTLAALGVDADILTALSGPDLGTWRGLTVADVGARDLPGLQSWLADPDAAPHGGESLAEVVARVGEVCVDGSWPDGRSVVVVSPLVARAAAAHALGDADLIFRVDVAPAGSVTISLDRPGESWRLQRLG